MSRCFAVKAALLVAAVTAAPGLADAEPLQMVPAPPGAEPVTARRTCDDEGVIRAARRVVGTVTALVVHDCGMDAMTQMALHTSRGWFTSSSTMIAYVAGNMTEFPLHVTLVAERLSTGTLVDGTRAIIQTVETAQRTDAIERVLVVQICSADDEPSCAFLRQSCGATACPTTIRLSRGTLIIGTERRQVLR